MRKACILLTLPLLLCVCGYSADFPPQRGPAAQAPPCSGGRLVIGGMDAEAPGGDVPPPAGPANAEVPGAEPARAEGSDVEPADASSVKPNLPEAPSFNWRGAIDQSVTFLAVEHAFRLTQRKTRTSLGGPYWRNYGASVRGVCCRWGDGDRVVTNYVGHPMMGAMAGYIQIHNDPTGKRLQFENSRDYWRSRAKALGWSALYSTQFEIGPFLSEASIGNVGLKPGSSGFSDFVMTPAGGVGFIVLEDWIDKKWILAREMEGGGPRRWRRVLLNPSRSLANVLRMKVPWHRDNRTSPILGATASAEATAKVSSDEPAAPPPAEDGCADNGSTSVPGTRLPPG